MFEKRNKGKYFARYFVDSVVFVCGVLYCGNSVCKKKMSFSPLIVGIILGMLYANSLRNRLPETWVPGIKFCTKQLLRAGIVLYGFRLTLSQVAQVGLSAVVVDLIIVCGTIFLGVWLGRLLKLDSDTALMTATGSSFAARLLCWGRTGSEMRKP